MLANCLSALRIAVIPVIVFTLWHQLPALSSGLFIVVVASDVLDGYVARRNNTTSAFGTLLDHGADASFVSAVIAIGAADGLVTWSLPALIAVAFIQYAIDNPAVQSAQPLPSTLGRINGILYYVLSGLICSAAFFEGQTIAAIIALFGYFLVFTTLASIALRLRRRLQVRTTRD